MYFDYSLNLYLENEPYLYNETINDKYNLLQILKDNDIQEIQNEQNSSFMNNNINLDEQTTKTQTVKKVNTLSNIELNKEYEYNYKCFTFKEIKNVLDNAKFTGIFEKLKKNDIIEKAEYRLCNKKRKRVNEYENKEPLFSNNNNEEAEEKVKRGRKIIKEDNNKYKKEHNKYSEDNIIKKIKAKLFFYPLIFLNNILNRKIYDKNRLYPIDYKYINKLNKDIDLKMLKMPLKDIYSLDVSSKYPSIAEQFNKNVINKIIEKKIEVEDYPTTIFAFNLSFERWLELFTYKKKISEIIKDYEGFKDVNIEKIEKSLLGVEDLLKTISETNDEDYFSFYTFFLYNYERYFYIRRRHNKKE